MQAFNKKSVEDIEVKGKRALIRCDFNVPVTDGVIDDDKRIREALPTLRYLVKNGAKIIICSHFGRPKGGFDKKYSLAPVAGRLSELLGMDVAMAADVIGPDAKAKAAALKSGEVMLLENVRFHSEEEANDPAFAKELASIAEIYVNDAFGTAHRAHASTAGVAAYLPAVCGYLMEKEIRIMGGALANPKRPFIAVLGGAKVSDKIGLLNNLIDKCDTLVVGGGMAYTFIKKNGGSIGNSLCENDKLEMAGQIMEKAKAKGVEFLLPVDHIAGDKFSNDSNRMITPCGNIPDGWQGFDIGPETIKLFCDRVRGAGTVIWNGPMGVFEFENFAAGTNALAKAIAESGAVSIIGGGDSAAAVEKSGYADKVTHISTGGGAAMEFLEGIALPGVACLNDK